jgi:hypothetical protein
MPDIATGARSFARVGLSCTVSECSTRSAYSLSIERRASRVPTTLLCRQLTPGRVSSVAAPSVRWGTLANASQDRQLHAESFVFTSPLSGGLSYERVAFEADFRRSSSRQDATRRRAPVASTHPGSELLPHLLHTGNGPCGWQEGGTHIPGTTNMFGGTSTSEYGPLLALVYPDFPGSRARLRSTRTSGMCSRANPCPSMGTLPG